MESQNILLVDNEEEIRDILKLHLLNAEMKVFEADSGQRALSILNQEPIDLIILDLMMERMDGWEVLKHMQQQQLRTPVIVLSARQMETDKIEALDLGADDYMTKPFSPGELIARIQAILRRSKPDLRIKQFKLGASIFDVEGSFIQNCSETIPLSPIEGAMLELFLQNPGKIFTHKEIFREVWKLDHVDNNSVKVYVNYLRKKIGDDPAKPRYIQTIRGIGYRFLGDPS
ncbi:DNA-binding response regulator [Xylanibacillus composti]|uniref:DNA-binding response regulator n=1 Tax=Xylanibacillus composti TaxID=1572762 RepID=A0A8J4H859_9BACL|nr:response regulator transcription factor [Xylanibacillus composti]MDT9723739.1 DNA-binding response regulator [Xylanibacillus composti]GIQ70794.1 DNA-binding response regulator [Xylanibacillus composti]